MWLQYEDDDNRENTNAVPSVLYESEIRNHALAGRIDGSFDGRR